jgi:hypothetical protein
VSDLPNDSDSSDDDGDASKAPEKLCRDCKLESAQHNFQAKLTKILASETAGLESELDYFQITTELLAPVLAKSFFEERQQELGKFAETVTHVARSVASMGHNTLTFRLKLTSQTSAQVAASDVAPTIVTNIVQRFCRMYHDIVYAFVQEDDLKQDFNDLLDDAITPAKVVCIYIPGRVDVKVTRLRLLKK